MLKSLHFLFGLRESWHDLDVSLFKVRSQGLKKGLSGYMHWLFIQESGSSPSIHLLAHNFNSNLRISSVLFWPFWAPRINIMHKYVHPTHTCTMAQVYTPPYMHYGASIHHTHTCTMAQVYTPTHTCTMAQMYIHPQCTHALWCKCTPPTHTCTMSQVYTPPQALWCKCITPPHILSTQTPPPHK